MSGIYIKSMEMPTSCRACQWSRTDITNTDWCVLTEKDLPCDCPLIAVPDHGRLVDADALGERMHAYYGYSERLCGEIDDFITSAPTIIPAEEGE